MDASLSELREQALRLPQLRAVGARHPDGVRRGADGRADAVRRRAARATRRTGRAGRSSAPPASCSIGRWSRPASTARQVYVTNAVKHFKFEPRGKRRIHQKPDYKEVLACKPWLLGELAAVTAPVVVALGATAAQSLIGRTVTIGKERGRFQPYPPDRHLFVTVHPSFLLRVPDERAQALEYRRFVEELQMIAAGPAATASPAPQSAAQRSLF